MDMKKLFVVIFSLLALNASASGIDCRYGVDHKHPACYSMYSNHAVNHRRHNHGHHHGHQYRGNDWVAPVIGAVVLGAVIHEATRPRVIEQPVIIEQYPVQTICTEWREVLLPDGRIQRERTCYQR
jgi:hypothetical protein